MNVLHCTSCLVRSECPQRTTCRTYKGRTIAPISRLDLSLHILQSVCLGIDMLSYFLNVQHCKIACATQTFFSSDAYMHSCHKCFFHYRQPPSLHQSVLIFERFATANAKPCIFLHLFHPTYGPPQICRSTAAIDMLQLGRSWGGPYVISLINTHKV